MRGTLPQGERRPIRPGTPPRKTDGTGAPASGNHGTARGGASMVSRTRSHAVPAVFSHCARFRHAPQGIASAHLVGCGRETEPAGRGPSPYFLLDRFGYASDHTGVAHPVNAAAPIRSRQAYDRSRFGR